MSLSPDIRERLNAALADLMPREARWAYWQTPDGTMFIYNTERNGAGKFGSGIYVPKGKGSRSGDPDHYALRREVYHSTRRAAKARAYRLYQERLAATKGNDR